MENCLPAALCERLLTALRVRLTQRQEAVNALGERWSQFSEILARKQQQAIRSSEPLTQ
jgi:hypothetical protein